MDLPPKGVPEYRHWLKHKDKYGPVSSITVLGQTLVILHDRDAAHDLLGIDSTNTSGRPQSEFAHKLCGYERITALKQYNDEFRRQRKIMHQELGTKARAANYNAVQEVETRKFLLRVLNKPEDIFNHFSTATSAIILQMIYGYSINFDKSDILLDLIRCSVDQILLAFVPMGWLVDMIPALKYLPNWFPGTTFKERARQSKEISEKVANMPYSFVKRQMRIQSHRPSFVSRLLEEYTNSKAEEPTVSNTQKSDIKWVASTLYTTGADTIVATLRSFIYAMIKFPDVQRKAQKEIDQQIGAERLPGFKDRDNLPYIGRLVMEAHRWSSIAPMCVPHRADKDLMCHGYHIPKTSIIIPALWWFCHDPEVYKDPHLFNPDRFSEPQNEPDPTAEIFGFGRRSCPGKYVGSAGVFIIIVQTLAAFNIKKAVDENGREIEIKFQTTSGIVSMPDDFPCWIVPRSTKYAELVQNIDIEQPWEGSDSHLLETK